MKLPLPARKQELATLADLGIIRRKRRSWWEADHILPVVEGGDSSLDNMRTLCIPCHSEATDALRRRLKRTRIARKESSEVFMALPTDDMNERGHAGLGGDYARDADRTDLGGDYARDDHRGGLGDDYARDDAADEKNERVERPTVTDARIGKASE